MYDEAMAALEQQTMNSTEHFLSIGARVDCTDRPTFNMIYDLELVNASYDKLLIGEQGRFWKHNAPVSMLLSTCKFSLWDIRDVEGKQLLIAYDLRATKENKWWATIRAVFNNLKTIPVLCGDLVVFKYQRPLQWTMKELQREVLNFVAQRYGNNNAQYKFSP